MTWQHLILYAVVVLWGLPAACRRWSALFIVSGWAVTEVFARLSGDNMPFRFEILVAVIIIMLMLRFDRHWLPMAMFAPLAATFYAKEAHLFHDYYVWHAGWALQIVQILLAGRWSYLPEAWSALNDMVRTGSVSYLLPRHHHRDAGLHSRADQADLHAAKAAVHPANPDQLRAAARHVGAGQ
jgi:hypothetical protein